MRMSGTLKSLRCGNGLIIGLISTPICLIQLNWKGFNSVYGSSSLSISRSNLIPYYRVVVGLVIVGVYRDSFSQGGF